MRLSIPNKCYNFNLCEVKLSLVSCDKYFGNEVFNREKCHILYDCIDYHIMYFHLSSFLFRWLF